MIAVNQATILGNVTKDPELRYTPNGNAVINFSVATNRQWKNEAGEKQEAVDYHNIVFWGKLAEIISQFVQKGNKIYIQGRLQTRSWEKDGVKRYATDIVGRDFILLSSKAKTAVKKELPSDDRVSAEHIPAKQEKMKVVKVNPEDIPF